MADEKTAERPKIAWHIHDMSMKPLSYTVSIFNNYQEGPITPFKSITKVILVGSLPKSFSISKVPSQESVSKCSRQHGISKSLFILLVLRIKYKTLWLKRWLRS